MHLLTDPITIEGYETVSKPPHTAFVRAGWKEALLEDLLDDFHRVTPPERQIHTGGRIAHFSYLPRGAASRVFVRKAARGGAIGTLLGGLYWGLGRPVTELRAASRALSAGVGVAEPLAVRATRVWGPFHRFTIVFQEIPGADNLLTLAPTLTPSAKREMISRLAVELRRMHEAGVYHSDLTLKNIVRSGGSVYIIDLDKATLAARREQEMDTANLSRLNRSVEKLQQGRGWVSRADKLRFLRCYLGGSRRLKELSRICANGLWMHRLWWALSGQPH